MMKGIHYFYGSSYRQISSGMYSGMDPSFMTELFFLSISLELNVIFLILNNYPCCVDIHCFLCGDKFKKEFFMTSARLENSDSADHLSTLPISCMSAQHLSCSFENCLSAQDFHLKNCI